jgi:hypothetical protein
MIEAELIADEKEAETPQSETEVSLLDLLVLLVARKRFVLRFVLSTALLAIVVSFLLPVRYEAKVVLLPPAQDSSIGSALLGQMGNMGGLGALASLASGSILKNPADMYVSLLTSRTVEDATIQRFGLMAEYHTKLMSDTRKAFERRTTVTAGSKDGLIRMTATPNGPLSWLTATLTNSANSQRPWRSRRPRGGGCSLRGNYNRPRTTLPSPKRP